MTWNGLRCAGCGDERPRDEVLRFACEHRNEAGDIDHVLRQAGGIEVRDWPSSPLLAEANPFIRYRRLSHSWHLAIHHGMSDRDYIGMIELLSSQIAAVSGQFPVVTPMQYCGSLNISVKNETCNISGSHKIRHLIATALHLRLAERLGLSLTGRSMAIASCGNAALAAAVVAKAAGFPLQVFIPPWADETVIAQLTALGAELIICERRAGDLDGDPCYLRFVEAVSAGALPFSCQGGDNALAIVGGHTLGWELIEQSEKRPFDRIFIQAGGGALASGVIQAYQMAQKAGFIASLPRFHAVQTAGSHPLRRAWDKLQSTDLNYASSHRSEYMWPWETPQQSIATGILDDETYDWLSIVEGLWESDGSVVTVSETQLARAQTLAVEHTQIAVDATGTAGLAGLLSMREASEIPDQERCAVLFTGAIR